jgi:hypothetical protein
MTFERAASKQDRRRVAGSAAPGVARNSACSADGLEFVRCGMFHLKCRLTEMSRAIDCTRVISTPKETELLPAGNELR